MRKKVKNRIVDLVITVMLVVGGLLLLYPIYANYMYAKASADSQKEYEQTVAEKDAAYKEDQLAKARAYNSTLTGDGLTDPFSSSSQSVDLENGYNEAFKLITINGIEGAMGYIEIPKISVDLPIFHGTSDQVLYQGVGHLIGSSLPTGDTGTHVVLTGHTGLQEKKLFTDLTKLETGDQFILTILDNKMAYQIDDIRVIEPTDTTWFTIDPDKDQVTLITCTPYGINSHRLLVTGHRIPYEEVQEVAPAVDWYIVGVFCLIGAVIAWLLYRFWKKKKKRRAEQQSIGSTDGK